MRNHRVGSITDAVSRAVEAYDGTHKEAAEFLGLAAATLSYGMDVSENRPGALGVAYLHRLGQHNPACAEPIAQHFAALAGGVFQPVETSATVRSLYECSGNIAKECGEAAGSLINATCSERDGDYDEAEREIDEGIASLVKAKALVAAKRRSAA